MPPSASSSGAESAPAAVCARPSPARARTARADGASPADDELVRLAVAGARHAFEHLVRRYQQPAVRLALRHTRDPEVAREMVQETFLAVFRALPDYEPRGKFSAFLFRVLINRCRVEFRRRSSERELMRCLEDTLPRAAHDAAPALSSREQRRHLDAAIQRLSAALREVLVLMLQGLTDDEISRALDRPVGTIRRRRFVAIAQLRALMGDDPPSASSRRASRSAPRTASPVDAG